VRCGLYLEPAVENDRALLGAWRKKEDTMKRERTLRVVFGDSGIALFSHCLPLLFLVRDGTPPCR